MGTEMSPEAALHAADAVRRAAADAPPRWFPAVVAVVATGGLALVGASTLIGGAASAALGVSGVVLLAVLLGLHLLRVAQWRRRGVIPRADQALTPRRRWIALAITLIGTALGAVLWGVTGRPGWPLIAWGVVAGAESWCRLTGWGRA